MRGVPLRIEIGAKDLESGSVVVVRRDLARGEEGQKTTVPVGNLAAELRPLLSAVHDSLYAQAKAFLDAHTFRVSDRAEFFAKCADRSGMIDSPWCARPECEAYVKAETSATTRNTRPLDAPATCVACGEPATLRAYFAQSY